MRRDPKWHRYLNAQGEAVLVMSGQEATFAPAVSSTFHLLYAPSPSH